MAFQLSPGVNVSEVDLTTVVPSVLTTAGAFVGAFQWGPANKRILVDSEVTLAKRFGTPDSNTYTSFFTAANFLSYGNNLTIVRAVNANCTNAQANSAALYVQIANEDQAEPFLLTNNGNVNGSFMARYPGALGSSLSVAVCANTALYSSWTYSNYFTGAPGTSAKVADVGGANDEIHIAVVDAGGLFTGVKGTVVETFPFVSKAIDATNDDGSSNYYKNVIYQKSKYIYAVDPIDYTSAVNTWGKTGANTNFYVSTTNQVINLVNGVDEQPTNADIVVGYDLFSNPNDVDVSLVITGNANTTVQQYVIDNVVNTRKDAVAFISPPSSAVVNNAGDEVADIQTWLTALARHTSYAFADSGWKYQFDKYNNVYRYVPLNGDTAGLCVYTDSVRDAWFSPAGFNRGSIKNAVKLAWNPTQTDRDSLYNVGVNPVVSFPGQGVTLFGDKTLLNKPSAFDRINVRRLFIVLEKAISTASKFSLFEFNDEFTRAQFVALVTPFLRDVQGRRGIFDFKVVCDTTNNTPQVIDSNQFVGDIYIKPARSINYIQLNFVAVRTGVDFTEVVGKF
jgi:phage tail sheath protein FI